MKRVRRILLWVSLPLLPVLLLLLFFGIGWQGYQRLTDEQLVAELTFDNLGPQRYEAILLSGDRCRVQRYLMLGDQWRLDARFLKWKPWANLLGLDARYRLERLEGRYQDIEQQNRGPLLAHALGESKLDPRLLTEALGPLNVFFDSRYGSSTFREMDPDLRYRVYRTQSGLITRAAPRPGARYEGGTLTLEINSACAPSEGLWQRASRGLASVFQRVFPGNDDHG
ncbi:hypothetical protein [Motiliproteus sp. SC1-56]|uniref:hypothetical protein n=1 Tax=Motiliproteus sp. SC1-56 TaxID=2799565 RepID=UPI001A8F2140|nr:hypothetical protein [Motiliproteus sp. SC1-56]